MTRLRTLLSRLADVLFQRSREDRLDAEVAHHMAMLTDELQAAGWSQDDARLEARRRFGGVDRVRMLHREQRGWPGFDALTQDLRFAVRLLTRERWFTLTAIVVLAVGIGANNMFFTLVYAHKYRGLPIAQPGRVLSIATLDDRGANRLLSWPEFEAVRESVTSFAGLGAWTPAVATVGDEGRAPDRFDAAYVSSGAFPALGIGAVMGRLPAAAEDRAGAPPVVVLGASAWEARYGGDTEVLGRDILVNGSLATVVGIVADRSGFPSTAQVWLPIGQRPAAADQQARVWRVFGRLAPGAGEAAARTEVETLFTRLPSGQAESTGAIRAQVVPINRQLLGSLDGWLAFITAGLIVVLVACANVANLMIARALHRAPEIAIRTSLGASRVRIVRQILVEAGVLAASGGVIGGVISVLAVRLFESAIPAGMLPYWFDYTMDRGVFAGLLAISAATVAVFGLVPALQVSKTDVNRTLKDGGRGSTASGGRAWTTGFLAVELALAVVLLAQTSLGNLSQRRGIPTDGALETNAVIVSSLTLPSGAYASDGERGVFYRRLDEALHAHADVVAVSLSSFVPAFGASNRRLDLDGDQPSAGTPPTVATIDIGARYFDTLGLGMTRGRAFTEADDAATAIVNDRFVEVFLPGEKPLGRRIAVTAPNAPPDAPRQWLTVVGVAPPVRIRPGIGADPIVYLPIHAAPPLTTQLLVRHRLDPSAAAQMLREQVRAIEANAPLFRMQSLDAAVRDALWSARVSNYLASTVTLVSLLMAAVGLYAVTSHLVTLRRRDIGLRMALGAGPRQVATMVLRGIRIPLILGLGLGALGAVAWDRAFSSGLVDEYAAAPGALLAVAAFLTAVIVAACLVPARRAMRTDPVAALLE